MISKADPQINLGTETRTMTRNLLSIALFFFSFSLVGQNADYLEYIERFKEIAITEMERAGVPASIKLGQGLLESGGGTSTLAIKANNHFGIKCGSKWTGKTHYRKDDDRDPVTGKLIKSCFRKYRNANASYVAHSEFLRDNRRYDFLFYLDARDYKRWAYGLKRAGYATSATYAEKLIRVIESYNLNQYDYYTSTDLIAGTIPTDPTNPTDPRPEPPTSTEQPTGPLGGIFLNNDVKMVLAKARQTPGQIAQLTNIPVKRILSYNEGITKENQKLRPKERVYLQKKRRSYRERKKYHYVKAGETMYQIAQLYGLRLKRLQTRNRMASGSQPAEGQKIKLRGWKVKPINKPLLVNEVPPRENKPSAFLPDEDNDGMIDLEDENGEIVPPPVKTKPTKRLRPTDPAKPTIPRKEPDVQNSTTGFDSDFQGQTTKPSIPATTTDDFRSGTSQTTEGTITSQPTNPGGLIEPPVRTDRPSSTTPNPTTTNTSSDDLPDELSAQYYTVIDGDTLYGIARRYKTTVEQIKSLNGLQSNFIRRGMMLRIK